jgi:hypothetical protein
MNERGEGYRQKSKGGETLNEEEREMLIIPRSHRRNLGRGGVQVGADAPPIFFYLKIVFLANEVKMSK